MSTPTKTFGVINGGRLDSLPARESGAKDSLKLAATNTQTLQSTPDRKETNTALPLIEQVREQYNNPQNPVNNCLMILWDNEKNQPIFIHTKNTEQLFDIMVKDYPETFVSSPQAKHHLVFIFEDTDEPFENYIPKSKIEEVKTWPDLEEIIRDSQEEEDPNHGYGELPDKTDDSVFSFLIPEETRKFPVSDKLNGDWEESANPNPIYSEKIQQVYELFKEQRKNFSANNKCLYIYLTENEELIPVPLPYALNDDQARSFFRHAHPDSSFILSLDLFQDFDEQIRNSHFDPETLLSWEPLKIAPFNDLKAVELIDNQLKNAPRLLGPKKPALAWTNPSKLTP
jgi:hypothetical protein